MGQAGRSCPDGKGEEQVLPSGEGGWTRPWLPRILHRWFRAWKGSAAASGTCMDDGGRAARKAPGSEERWGQTSGDLPSFSTVAAAARAGGFPCPGGRRALMAVSALAPPPGTGDALPTSIPSVCPQVGSWWDFRGTRGVCTHWGTPAPPPQQPGCGHRGQRGMEKQSCVPSWVRL